MKFAVALLLVAGLLLGSCHPINDEERLRLAVETARPGSVIEISEGVIAMSRSLTLNTDGVTIKGAGMDKTILDFSQQVQGAEGILVNASEFTVADLTIQNTSGDALKINQGRNIRVRRTRTQWTGGPSTENGAYGIYPVQVDGVLIEESVATGASDAGIYVGQSRNIIVRHNQARYNVAGIEIENSQDADVHGNLAEHNTGGILVFNMPNLPETGERTRVFDNDILSNNTSNFARAGTAVAGVPAGTGLLINAHDQVEVFANRFADNRTAHVLIASSFDADQGVQANFDPFPETLSIHDNEFRGGGQAPDFEALEDLRRTLFADSGRLPPVVWDGVVNTDKMIDGQLPPELRLCLGDPVEVEFVNLDTAGDYANVSRDTSAHQCVHDRLGAATAQASTPD